MILDHYIEKLLRDFIFRDSRLEDHPKVRVGIAWTEDTPSLNLPNTLTRYVLSSKSLVNVKDLGGQAEYLYPSNFESGIFTPLLAGDKAIGVLSLIAREPGYFQEDDAGTAQLLSAIVVYSGLHPNFDTPASRSLGTALKRAREVMGLTRAELADRIKKNRITISRWESGALPPSKEAVYLWGEKLGLFSSAKRALVTFVDITPRLLKILKDNPDHLSQLSPSQFEQFIAERLDRMGFDVTLTGAVSARDGGIDLVAVPKQRTVGAFLLAGQVKHHKDSQKTGRDAVDRLLAWKDTHFRLGLLVTNTHFSKDARWKAAEANNQAFLRLRDFEDLKQWLGENFNSIENWQEIPDNVQLAPGVSISIPKPKIVNPFDIWKIKRRDL